MHQEEVNVPLYRVSMFSNHHHFQTERTLKHRGLSVRLVEVVNDQIVLRGSERTIVARVGQLGFVVGAFHVLDQGLLLATSLLTDETFGSHVLFDVHL
jgi:hypothetical protein